MGAVPVGAVEGAVVPGVVVGAVLGTVAVVEGWVWVVGLVDGAGLVGFEVSFALPSRHAASMVVARINAKMAEMAFFIFFPPKSMGLTVV